MLPAYRFRNVSFLFAAGVQTTEHFAQHVRVPLSQSLLDDRTSHSQQVLMTVLQMVLAGFRLKNGGAVDFQ
jgi:hypothetical protein